MTYPYDNPRLQKELVTVCCWLVPICGVLLLAAGSSGSREIISTTQVIDFGSKEPVTEMMKLDDMPAEDPMMEQSSNDPNMNDTNDSERQEESQQEPVPDAISVNPVEPEPEPVRQMTEQQIAEKIQQYRGTIEEGECELSIVTGRGIHDVTQLGTEFFLVDELEDFAVVDRNGRPISYQTLNGIRIHPSELPFPGDQVIDNQLRGNRLVDTRVLPTQQLEIMLYRVLFDYLQSIKREALGDFCYEITVHYSGQEFHFDCVSFPRRAAK